MRVSEDEFQAIMKKRTGFFSKPTVPKPLTAKTKMQALGRLKTGEKNNTETAYGEHLEWLKNTGKVAWYKFEGMTFRLAKDTRYTPDYMVMLSTGQLEAHEVKGHWQDDARVKIKVAADMYPIKFIAIKKKTKKDGGGWQVEEF